MSKNDDKYLGLALELAAQADGLTSPNPRVGAVVVKNGRVVGTGCHRKAGSPHAEIHALKAAGQKARGATLYVSLEPCAHHGRTGPCTEAILRAGVARVVAGMVDPNPRVSGRGLQILRSRGVRAEIHRPRADECLGLNLDYVKFISTGLPYVTLKMASSLDGKVATTTGESRFLSGREMLRLVHELREKSDAILVGIGTVQKDDPELTVRLSRKARKAPLRVILDSRLRIPEKARVLQSQKRVPTLIATAAAAPRAKLARLRKRGVEVMVLPARGGRIDLHALLQALGKRGVMSLLVEGGPEVAFSFLAEKLIDRILFNLTPRLIGGRAAPGLLGGKGIERLNRAVKVRKLQVHPVGEDLLIEGFPVYS